MARVCGLSSLAGSLLDDGLEELGARAREVRGGGTVGRELRVFNRHAFRERGRGRREISGALKLQRAVDAARNARVAGERNRDMDALRVNRDAGDRDRAAGASLRDVAVEQVALVQLGVRAEGRDLGLREALGREPGHDGRILDRPAFRIVVAGGGFADRVDGRDGVRVDAALDRGDRDRVLASRRNVDAVRGDRVLGSGNRVAVLVE